MIFVDRYAILTIRTLIKIDPADKGGLLDGHARYTSSFCSDPRR